MEPEVAEKKLSQLAKTNKALRKKALELERENLRLKRVFYDMSVRCHRLQLKVAPQIEQEAIYEEGWPVDIFEAACGHAEQLFKEEAGERTQYRRKYHFVASCTLEGHHGAVRAVEFSPVHSVLASASMDATIRLWNVEGGHSQEKLQDHSLAVMDVAWSEDGRWLASGSVDRFVFGWDAEVATRVWSGNAEGAINSVAFDATSQLVLVGTTRRALRIFDIRSSENALHSKYIFQHPHPVNKVLWRSEHEVWSGDSYGYLRAWDMRTQKQLWEKRTAPQAIYGLEHDAITGIVGIRTLDGALRVFRLDGNEMESIHEFVGLATAQSSVAMYCGPDYHDRGVAWPVAATFQNSLLAVCGCGENACVFDIGGPKGTGEMLQRLRGHHDTVNVCTIHKNKPVLATSGADRTIKIWTLKTR